VHPQAEQESIFGHFRRFVKIWRWEWLILVVLNRLLSATSKKVIFRKKVHPQTTKKLATPLTIPYPIVVHERNEYRLISVNIVSQFQSSTFGHN